jgi:TolB-like protein/Tfp pilus assembly protein PilF
MSLFVELKRRNVFRVGLAYLVASWLLMQVVDVLAPVFSLPDWAPKLIFLILAIGLVPTIIFSWVFEMTPEGIKRESEVDRSNSITQTTAKKLDMVTIGLLVAAIAAVALDRFMPGQEAPTSGSEPSSITSTEQSAVTADQKPDSALDSENREEPEKPKPSDKSIAVLPFVNMSDDAGNEYFSDGISEEILNALAKIKDLKVAGRTSSFAFKGKNQDLRNIGVALNVAHILEGSVRKAGNRVRITAQLIKVDDGFHVWSENFDRELDDVFAIQDEISAAILHQLKAHLIGEEATSVARTDAKTYDLYLLAGQRIYERNQASLQMASDLLHEAITIDPDYAPAYAQLGIASYLLSETNYGELPAAEADALARQHFDKALLLDPNQAEAMAGLGVYYYTSLLDYDKGVGWLEKALAINPNLINASLWLSTALNQLGKISESISILEKSFARDPLHPPTFNNLSMIYAVSGEVKKAREMLSGIKRYLPSDAGLMASIGKVETLAGNWAEANRLLTEAIERGPLNFVDRIWLSMATLETQQFERLAEIGTDRFRAIALSRLGRVEEGLILGAEWVDKGNNPSRFFQQLTEDGRFPELIAFLESRWPDLDALESSFPSRSGYGAYTMGSIAHAYSRVGEPDKFDDAMARFQASLEWQIEQGADNWVLTGSRAQFAMLSGDHDGALEFLGQSFEQGGLQIIPLTTEHSVFAPLRGDPRFEALLVEMRERLNEHRAALGLEPVSA